MGKVVRVLRHHLLPEYMPWRVGPPIGSREADLARQRADAQAAREQDRRDKKS